MVTVKVVRQVSDDALWNKPLRTFLTDVMLETSGWLVTPGHVPIDHSVLADSIMPGAGTTRIDDADPPTFAISGTNIEYAGYLEDEDKTGRYHYRDGPSKGKATTGWMSAVYDDNGKPIDLDGLLNSLAADMEASWRA